MTKYLKWLWLTYYWPTVRDLMTDHYNNNATDEETWLWHATQDNKSNRRSFRQSNHQHNDYPCFQRKIDEHYLYREKNLQIKL